MPTKKLSFFKEATSPFALLWWFEDGEDRGLQTIFIPYEDARFLASDLKGIFPIADYVFPEYNDFDGTGLNVSGSQEALELMASLRKNQGLMRRTDLS